jgi:hypothetical protein
VLQSEYSPANKRASDNVRQPAPYAIKVLFVIAVEMVIDVQEEITVS